MCSEYKKKDSTKIEESDNNITTVGEKMNSIDKIPSAGGPTNRQIL